MPHTLLATLALAAASHAPAAIDPIEVYIVANGYMVQRVTVQSADQLVPLIPQDSDQPIQIRACGGSSAGQLLPLVNVLSVDFKARLSSNVIKTAAGESGCPKE